MNGRQDRFDGRDEGAAGPGSILVWASGAVAVILLIMAFVYISGGSGRIAKAYTAVAAPADQALTAEVASYTHSRRHDLAAAKADLGNEVRTESAFDVQIANFTFPNAAVAAGAALQQADQNRVELLTLQARSASFRQLRSFDARVQAANAAVAAQVGAIRQDLGLPAVGAQQY